ncbi:MAG: ImmA/IrrE family metallo-endopeptidase [Saprospiraceae bacterium]
MRTEVNIKPDMITWAIGRAGYDLEDFITKKLPAVQEWLDDKKKPTVKQLEEFSHKVHLPFGYLFLPEPLVEQLPIPFFRTGRSAATRKVSLNIQETIQILKRRQDWLTDYLKESEGEPLAFVGKFGLKNSPEEIASDIRHVLQLEKDWASHFATWTQAKTHLAQKIEDVGIVVNFNSIVGNNAHRKIKVEECRGFVLVDAFAPFLFVNSADAKAAQMFTLAHELAHVWTGQSAGFDFQQMLPADDPMEKLCDQVAAEFLVPATAFIPYWNENSSIQAAARHFKVSPIVAARRALDLGLIDREAFFAFYHEHMRQEHFKKSNQNGGGDFYATQKLRLGLPFLVRLNQALKEGKVLYKDVYSLSGLKGETYQQFVHKTL